MLISYHAVGSGPWSMPRPLFEEQIAWLSTNAAVRPLQQLLADTSDDAGLQVAITFDDGYRSVLTHATPILDRAGVTASLFVSTGVIADQARLASDSRLGYYPEEEFLLWDEVRELSTRGWTIGSHGIGHIDLTQSSPANVEAELSASKAMLESQLDRECLFVAYPFGRANADVKRIARHCGYRWAVRSIHGTLHGALDPYDVPRIDIRRDYSLGDFAGVMQGHWDYLRLVQRVRHATGFYA